MLRGLACLGVCIMHFAGTVDSESLNKVTQLGGYGVPVFFTISGFILPYSLWISEYKVSSFFRFILKRLIRLEPAYLFSILGIFILSFLAQLSPFSDSTQIEFFTTNTCLHLFYLVDFFNEKWLNPVYWTLAIEFQFYLIIGLIFPFLNSSKICILITSFALIILTSTIVNNESYLPYYFLMFLPGILLFWYTSKKISLKIFIILFLIFGFFSFEKHGLSGPICATISTVFILFITKPIQPLIFLGTISYSLYLIHTIVGTDGIINFMQNFIPDQEGRIWLMIIALPITIAFAWVFYLIIEKPSKKLSKKIGF